LLRSRCELTRHQSVALPILGLGITGIGHVAMETWRIYLIPTP
jgi:hypothetical protein